MKRKYKLTGKRFFYSGDRGDGILRVTFFDTRKSALVWRIGQWAYELREVE